MYTLITFGSAPDYYPNVGLIGEIVASGDKQLV